MQTGPYALAQQDICPVQQRHRGQGNFNTGIAASLGKVQRVTGKAKARHIGHHRTINSQQTGGNTIADSHRRQC